MFYATVAKVFVGEDSQTYIVVRIKTGLSRSSACALFIKGILILPLRWIRIYCLLVACDETTPISTKKCSCGDNCITPIFNRSWGWTVKTFPKFAWCPLGRSLGIFAIVYRIGEPAILLIFKSNIELVHLCLSQYHSDDLTRSFLRLRKDRLIFIASVSFMVIYVVYVFQVFCTF